MVFKSFSILVLWTKVASALEVLKQGLVCLWQALFLALYLLAFGSSLRANLDEILIVDHLLFPYQWRGVMFIKEEPEALTE